MRFIVSKMVEGNVQRFQDQEEPNPLGSSRYMLCCCLCVLFCVGSRFIVWYGDERLVFGCHRI